MSKELEYDPETGEVGEVKPKSKFKKSLFVDEESADSYHSEIKFEGYTVYLRELSEEFLNEHVQAESELEKQVLALKPKTGARISDEQRTQIQAKTKQLLEAQSSLMIDVLEKAIVGWTLPRELSRGAIEKLSKTARNSLGSKVIKSAGLGQSEADFLPQRS